MRQPTIKDVASLAGVSISTVSRVMNKSKPVSPEAEKKVIDAINKLGFKPNELARSLVMKKSNSIGVLVKDIGIDYMAQMIRGVEEIGKMYHYDILLSSTYGELESEKRTVDFLYRKQVEGIIVISEDIEAEIIVKIRGYNLPYILLDRYYKSNDFHTVTVDYQNAMRMAAEHLISKGHKNILYMKVSSVYEVSAQKRAGYESAMRAHGLKSHYVETQGGGAKYAGDVLEPLLSELREGQYTAILTESDALALGSIGYLYDHGIAVPEDVSIVGFGNSPLSELFRPTLTTISEPYYDIGAVGMRMLTKTLKNEEKMTESIYLPTTLMERGSVKTL